MKPFFKLPKESSRISFCTNTEQKEIALSEFEPIQEGCALVVYDMDAEKESVVAALEMCHPNLHFCKDRVEQLTIEQTTDALQCCQCEKLTFYYFLENKDTNCGDSTKALFIRSHRTPPSLQYIFVSSALLSSFFFGCDWTTAFFAVDTVIKVSTMNKALQYSYVPAPQKSDIAEL